MPTTVPDIWQIEMDPDYRTWLGAVQSGYPVSPPGPGFSKLAPGSSGVGRSAVVAEERDGRLMLKVILNTRDEFSKPWQGTFRNLVEASAAEGFNIRGDSPPLAEFEASHGAIVRLEFVSSHVGGHVRATAADGVSLFLDES